MSVTGPAPSSISTRWPATPRASIVAIAGSGATIIQGAPRIGPALSGELKTLVDEKAALIRRWIADGKIAEVNPHHLIFSIWALTQHYADFDVQVHAVLGGPEIDPYPEAQRYLETLFSRMLTP